MYAVRRIAVAAGDVAAFEATVQHHAVALYRFRERLAGGRRAGFAVRGAEVQIGELAVEEARQLGKDRVGIPEKRVAVLRLGFRERLLQALVIRLPIRFDSLPDLFVGRWK